MRYRSARVLGGLLASVALVSPAQAQLTPPAPVRQTVDGNGVNLFTGTLIVRSPALTIGRGEQGLSYAKTWTGAGWTDSVVAALYWDNSRLNVSFGGQTDSFTRNVNIYTATEGNGATLIFDSATGFYTYTRADGTIIRFDKALEDQAPYYANEGRATEVVTPSGAKLVYTYESADYCSGTLSPSGCTATSTIYRVASLRNSFGYKLALTYARALPGPTGQQIPLWSKVTGVTASNLAAPSGTGLTQTYATITGGENVTDPMGRVTSFTYAGSLTAIRLPGSAANDVTYGYTSGRVTSVATPSGTTAYSSSDAAGVRTVTVTDPLAHVTTYKFDIASQRMTSVIDANSRATSAQYDGSGRLTRVTQPEGNYTQLTYDPRGNVTERRDVAKTGPGPGDIVTTANYPATCTNQKTCNQPIWTRDARDNQTDYSYDATHGGLLTVTSPAPAPSATRPQIRYSYSSLQAYFNTGGGSIVPSGEPVILLTATSACQTGATCTGTADEVKSTIGYGPQTAGVGNNLLPVSAAKGAGDGSLTATTAYTYDDVGNLTYADGPLTGTADISRALYNANRETIGSISPDPDGAGALKNRARRITIDSRGLVTKTENGTTNGQTDPDWAAFVAAEAVEVAYDASRRAITSKLSSGATAYALTQTSYDAGDRVDCVATRMNPAVYGSLPASACTLGTQGSFGPDRIAKTLYDNADQVTGTQVALGTADQASEATLTYSANGRLQTLKDAENNLTTYEYDGFDRLAKTRMPLPTQGSNASSTTDYEQLTYDAASNVTNRRLRDAQNIAFTYDNLDRPTLKNLPGTEPDVTYAYDNLSRLTSASQTGNSLSFSYDALSRNLTQVGPLGTVASQWDVAGRRTKLTYPGSGLYIDYDYLVTGEMTKLRENGATSGVGVLATIAYDDLGRRSSLTRGNGTATSYAYDPVSRLATLAEDMASTGNDQSTTFAYNPASQIASLTKTNDAYAWTGHGNGGTASVANGLNQLTSIGGTATTHDARGNLTSDPTAGKALGYSSENLLTSATGGTSATLIYDPAMRLAQITGAATTKLQYDGLALIAEYDASNALTKRYVHGPGIDEPLVEYDASATRHWLHADERGSIIAQTDATGAVTQINRYDEYGRPQATNVGRFQYAGQTWLSEVGAYYYKARFYSPTMGGRFYQTDPIGYEGGINRYAYVGNDPINWIDPLGLCSNGVCPDITVIGKRLPGKESSPGDVNDFYLVTVRSTALALQGFRSQFRKLLQIGDFHYRVQDIAFCSADELFDQFSKAGNSAPGAPAATPGTTPDIVLTGGNPITQVVDPNSRTITNITQEGHRYHSGTVEIRITPTWYGSAVSIEGRGTGPRYLENRLLGAALFQALAARATIACTVGAD